MVLLKKKYTGDLLIRLQTGSQMNVTQPAVQSVIARYPETGDYRALSLSRMAPILSDRAIRRLCCVGLLNRRVPLADISNKYGICPCPIGYFAPRAWINGCLNKVAISKTFLDPANAAPMVQGESAVEG